MKAKSARRSGTNSPAPWGYLQYFKLTHPSIRLCWGRGWKCLQSWASSPSPANHSQRHHRWFEGSWTARLRYSISLVYLVASHHGKVRVALHAAPKDQEYRDRDGRGLPIRGIREGDRLPSVAVIPGEPLLPEVTLTLWPAMVGLSERTGISWRERCLGLMERYGPAGLAFLEAILRAADVRASRLKTNDPILVSEVNA